MRLLPDQDVYAVTAIALRESGHDVVTAAQLNLSRAKDTELLQRAAAEQRILVTRDKDYGGLVFVGKLGRGVILLRVTHSTIHAVHTELLRTLALYSEDDLAGAFLVIEPGMHRFRKLI